MRRRCLAECLGLIGILLAGGCTLKGGGLLPSAAGTSSPLTWESTAACSKTVAIVDTRTGETVFEYDIPLGKQLSVQFYEHKDPQEHPEAPDIMRYDLLPLGRWVGTLDDSVEVPHAWNRRIDVFFRTPESYTPPDPTAEVVPFEVPIPEAAAADDPDSATDEPGTAPADEPEAARTHSAAEPSGEDTADSGSQADAPPEAAVAGEEPAITEAPAAREHPVSAETQTTRPATKPHEAGPHSTMTWTDTGASRRVSVIDIKTGERVFEVDVPAGHDLVLHFHTMWTPPGDDSEDEAMHWGIVPAGTVLKAPPHHARVPGRSTRRVSEHAVAPPPAPAATAAPPATSDGAEQTAPKPTGPPPPTTPPPVDLIDDRDEPTGGPETPQH
ncbi:MAG: hypothetical protein QF561_05790 [Phycisphaerales bacterium]|jgi:hypothetical protein|nr:hypothetical protein [Phycisphaerales bacterium]